MYQTAATIAVAETVGTDFVIPAHSHASHYGDIESDFSGFLYPFKRQDVQLTNKYHQPTFGYTPIPPQDDLELHGFYQAHQYFHHIRQKLIHIYYDFNNKVLEDASKYNCDGNTLGVSVRRGDYIMLQHNHCVLSLDYYQSAFEKYFPEVDKLYVFSDDYKWCREIFGNDAIYPEGENGFTQMYLMTKMKHLILSNSTFAWWGGYLNDRGGKIVIPDPWFGPANFHHDTSGLYCPDWIRHKHEIQIV